MRTRSPCLAWMVGPGHEPLKPQQSIVFQGAIFRLTGSVVSWNPFTPLSTANGRSLTSGVITGSGVELVGRSVGGGGFMPNNREAPAKPATVVIALWINVRRELIVLLSVELL